VFASERGGPMTRFNLSKMIEAAGERAGLPFAHPHMLSERIQREIEEYNELSQMVMQLTKTISESVKKVGAFHGSTAH
jgi:hypothetical protein